MANVAPRWRDSYTAMIVDLARFMRPARLPGAVPATEGIETPGRGVGEQDDQRPTTGWESEPDLSHPRDPSSVVRARMIRFLEKQTGQRFGDDLGRWRAWMWQLPYEPHPDYAAFKGAVYGQIDPRMGSSSGSLERLASVSIASTGAAWRSTASRRSCIRRSSRPAPRRT